MNARSHAILLVLLAATGCGGYWRQQPIPQDAWVPTMSEQSKPRVGVTDRAAGGVVAGSTASRLEELQALHERGLVTDAEYRKKRQQIIDGL